MERLLRKTGPSYCKNGEGWSYGAQSSGSERPQECERPGASGGRSSAHRMPRIHGKALGAADGGHGGGAVGRHGQPLARNRVRGPGEVDSEGVVEGIRLHKRRRGHGISDRPVHRW